MDMKRINLLYQEALHEMNIGDLQGALNLTREIQSVRSDQTIVPIASGLLIDIGDAPYKREIIEEGIELLEMNFDVIVGNEGNAPNAYYNLAIGYCCLFHF